MVFILQHLHLFAFAISSTAAIKFPGESTSTPTSKTAAAERTSLTCPNIRSLMDTFGPELHWDRQPVASIINGVSEPAARESSSLCCWLISIGMRSLIVWGSPPSYLDGNVLQQSLFWHICILMGFGWKAKLEWMQWNATRWTRMRIMVCNFYGCMLYSCMQLAADDAYTTLYCDYLVYFNFNCKYDDAPSWWVLQFTLMNFKLTNHRGKNRRKSDGQGVKRCEEI